MRSAAPARWKYAALAVTAIILSGAAAGACAKAAPAGGAEGRLAALFPDLIGRPLTAAESSAVFAEFTALMPAGAGRCEADCLKVIAANEAMIARLREARGAPLEIYVRERFVELTYFNDRQRGGLIQRLIAGANPIAVVDPKSSRLMTHDDVTALAWLVTLAEQGVPPKARPLTEADRARIIKAVNAGFGPASGRLNSHLPMLWSEASAVWRGVERNWRKLSPDERRALARAVLYPNKEPPAAAVIGKLYETRPEETQSLSSAYQTAASLARINELTRTALRAGEMTIQTMTVVNAVNEAVAITGD